MTQRRIEFVDVAKGIATILVIIGHLSYTPTHLKIWLYTFHIPLFFFLSGFVLNCNKYNSCVEFIHNKVVKTLLPYFYLSIITWIFNECIYQSVFTLDINSLKKFLGIFICAKDTPYYLTLWFIISLFFAQLVIYLLNCLKNDKMMIASLGGLFILGVYISSIYEPGWIFVSDTIPMASVFVGLGFIARKYFSKIKQMFNLYWMIILAIINILFGFINLNGIKRVDLFYQDLGNPIYYFISAICGIMMICILSQYIRKTLILQFIGKNSLIFYAFHRPIFIPIADKLIDMCKSLQLPFIQYEYIQMLIAVVFIIVALSITTKFINRYCPFIVGKKQYMRSV